MKLTIIGIALLSTATLAYCSQSHAGGKPNQGGNVSGSQHQGQYQGQIQGQGQLQASENANNSSVDIQNRRQIPAAGVGFGGASSNTTAMHRYLEQESRSLAWGAVAWTDVKMKFDLVSFISSSPDSRAELAACIEHDSMRKLRALEGNACPAFTSEAMRPLGQK
jgi:hypothetical protein